MLKPNREWLRYFGMLVLTICLCLGIASFSILDKFQAWKENKDASLATTEQTVANPTNKTSQPKVDSQNLKNKNKAEDPFEVKRVNLYFSDGKGEILKAESRKIPKAVGLARATIEALIDGPADSSGLVATIPVGTQLNSINIKNDGLCVADFSDDLLYNDDGNVNDEFLTVYSIVKTLGQFESVNKVQILVNGRIVKTLAGSIDISQPINLDK